MVSQRTRVGGQGRVAEEVSRNVIVSAVLRVVDLNTMGWCV